MGAEDTIQYQYYYYYILNHLIDWLPSFCPHFFLLFFVVLFWNYTKKKKTFNFRLQESFVAIVARTHTEKNDVWFGGKQARLMWSCVQKINFVFFNRTLRFVFLPSLLPSVCVFHFFFLPERMNAALHTHNVRSASAGVHRKPMNRNENEI